MKKTTLEEFRAALRATGGYDTAPDHRRPTPAKPGAWVTARFSWWVTRVFPLAGLCEMVGKLTTEKWAELCFTSLTGAEKLGMNVHLEGWKNRESYDGPVVYVCNHMSTVETCFLPPVLMVYGKINIIAKRSLTTLPFLNKATVHMGIVPIDRKSPREDLLNILRVSEERIKAGNSFLVFPQGTRQKVFDPKRFSSIGAKMAERAKCPIVPIVVDTRCQPTREKGILRKIFKDFGPVDTSKDIRCHCGPVIPAGRSKAMQEAALEWMVEEHKRMGLPLA